MTTRHHLELFHAGGAGVDLSGWAWTAPSTGLPASLWGTVNNGEPELSAATVTGLTGARGVPPAPARTGPPPVPLPVLGQIEVPAGRLPLDEHATDGSTGPPPRDTRLIIRDTVMSDPAVAARRDLVSALTAAGLGRGLVDGDLSRLAAQARRTFLAEPMLGPPGTTGPRHEHRPVSPPRPGRAAAPASPRPAPGRATAPGLVLAAVCRWYQGYPVACVLDHRASPAERAVAAGLTGAGGTARLAPGTTLAWTLPPAAEHQVLARGPAPVAVTALDPQYQVTGRAALRAGEPYLVPRGTAHLIVDGVVTGPRATGWAVSSRLFQAGPQALLGTGVLVRPQAPARASRGQSGVISGADLLAQNWTESGAGRQRGWIVTTVPAATRTVTVALARDDGTPGAAAEPEQPVAWLLANGRRQVLTASRDGAARATPATSGPVTYLTYGLPPAAAGADGAEILVEPPPEWYQAGLTADEPESARARFVPAGGAEVRVW